MRVLFRALRMKSKTLVSGYRVGGRMDRNLASLSPVAATPLLSLLKQLPSYAFALHCPVNKQE